MTFDEFVKTHKNKKTDDLVSDFLKEVVGIPQISVDCPRDCFIRFEHFEQLTENFIKLPNTQNFIPKKGDLCVWGSGVNNGLGRACLATGKGDEKHFFCLGINRRGRANIRRYNYRFFIGALREK